MSAVYDAQKGWSEPVPYYLHVWARVRGGEWYEDTVTDIEATSTTRAIEALEYRLGRKSKVIAIDCYSIPRPLVGTSGEKRDG